MRTTTLASMIENEVLDSFAENPVVRRLVNEIILEVAADILSGRDPAVKRAVRLAADADGVTVAQILGPTRVPKVSRARAIAAWVLRHEGAGRSLPVIANLLGYADHTSVMHVIKRVDGNAQMLADAREILARVQPSAGGERTAEAA
jgi:chromosomal replication initiation ATPase DnaA